MSNLIRGASLSRIGHVTQSVSQSVTQSVTDVFDKLYVRKARLNPTRMVHGKQVKSIEMHILKVMQVMHITHIPCLGG